MNWENIPRSRGKDASKIGEGPTKMGQVFCIFLEGNTALTPIGSERIIPYRDRIITSLVE